MGIGSNYLKILTKLKKGGYLESGANVIEIGAQQLHNSLLRDVAGIKALGAVFDVKTPFKKLEPTISVMVNGNMESLQRDAPYARELYGWLGFKYAAVDIDGSPDSLPLDLNYDSAPSESVGKYNLVTNFGTTEHAANQINAFKVIHDLTATNGVMIHEVPAQGFMTHGLVNYNLKFFWALARSNNYQVLHMDLSLGGAEYPLPADILDGIGQYGNVKGRPPYKTSDVGILSILRKVHDIPFVGPLDIPAGTKAPNHALEQRYWTVFNPNAFKMRKVKWQLMNWLRSYAILRRFVRWARSF
jgi:hypothetical protein